MYLCQLKLQLICILYNIFDFLYLSTVYIQIFCIFVWKV